MAVYVAYSDEAGADNPDQHFIVSGHIAAETEWPWVIRAWQERVLGGPPKLPYLHMIDIRREEWQQRYKLSSNDAEGRVDEAVRVLYSMGAISAVASVVKRLDLEQVIHSKFKRKKNVPIGLDEPDYLCFNAYAIFTLGEVYRSYPEVERVDFVVSEKAKVSERLKGFYEPLRKWVSENYPELERVLGDLRPGSMEEEIPLQTADVLSWHLQRYYRGGFDRTIENRIWYLMKERDGHKHDWERTDLEGLAAGLGLS